MALYSWIILLSFAGPFLLSFDKKVAFYKSWPILFKAILPVAFVFILWDIVFTYYGVWGFNSDYLSGIFLFNLPWEEVAFFFVIPYSCVFIYAVLQAYFPSFIPNTFAQIFALIFVILGALMIFLHPENWYTVSACGLALLLTFLIHYYLKLSWYSRFVLTYIVVIIPFLVVNGILTGIATPEPVVWYSEAHIIGIRAGTIPLEDFFYNYSLLLPIFWLIHSLRNRKKMSSL